MQIVAVLVFWKVTDVCTALLLSILLPIAGRPSEWGATVNATASEVVGAVCAVLTVVLLQRLSGTVDLGRIGLTRKAFGTETVLGFLVGMSEYLLLMFCFVYAKLFVVDRVDNHFPFAGAALLALSFSVGEEIVFRGFIFQKLEAKYGTGLAIVASSVVFGAYHIGGGTYGDHYLNAMTAGLTGGLLYSSAYLINRRLWLPIGIHFAWDFFAFVFWGLGWGSDKPLFVPLLMDLHLDLHKAPQSILMGDGLGLVESPISIVLDIFLSVVFLIIAVRHGQWKKRKFNLLPLYRVDGGIHKQDADSQI